MLEDHVRPRPVEDCVEPPYEDGVAQPLEQLSLGGEPAERVLVVDERRADELHDDEGIEVVVPREVRLVPLAATEEPDREAAGDDFIPLRETPSVGGRRRREARPPPGAAPALDGREGVHREIEFETEFPPASLVWSPDASREFEMSGVL